MAIDDPGGRAERGLLLARGVGRALHEFGYTSLSEFTLPSGRRVDLMGVDSGGTILIVEIKSRLEDFRGDRKWPEYLDYCDHFYFAVPERFPREVLPPECGLLVADAYGAAVVREAPRLRLHPARRRVQILRFAWTAAQRLAQLTDPQLGAWPRQGLNAGPRAW